MAFYQIWDKSDYLTKASEIFIKLNQWKDGNQDKIIPYGPSYQDRMLVDTLGMTIPFLVQYAQQTRSEDAMDLACHCMSHYLKYGVNRELGLPYHAVQIDTKLPEGAILWTRGVGWYLLALGSLVQGQAPAAETYRQSALRAYETLLKYAPDMLFSGFVSETTPLDTSGTAMILLGLHWAGVKAGEPEKNIKALRRHIRRDGTVLSSLGDCLGLNTYALSYGYTPYGQAYTSMLVAEYACEKRLGAY